MKLLTLATGILDRGDAQQQIKNLLSRQNEEFNKHFDPQRPVARLLKAKADFIDNLLSKIWQYYLGHLNEEIALLAVGGYGRQELFPHSDIDIMVLLDQSTARQIQEPLALFFNFLWDIGLKPGQSVRTVNECVQAAKDDQTVMTSLLEIRLICGSKKSLQHIKQLISSDKIWPSDQFFAAKMQEQSVRYSKYDDTAYKLEPNIKEGPGGLRDMQVIAWVFKRHYDSTTLKELIKYDFLPESEYAELIAAQQILWRLRYALHVLTGRSENRLLFDHQRELAKWFGFTDNSNNHDVEEFMQFYFKTVVGLERLNEMLLQLFSERFVKNPRQVNEISPINTKFYAIAGFIEIKNENVFVEHPLALLEIFLLLQQIPSLKGIRATTIRQIRKNLHLINDDFRNDSNAQHLFIEILKQPHGITHQLRQMNRYGVLAAYLPSFGNIVARMQYDLFHIYTVDEHTLFVIRNLRRYSLRKHFQEKPFCYNVFLLIQKPQILYISALFHDIAKGKGGDHSILGADIAQQFCKQHQIGDHDTNAITWLVRNHLLMSMTAQRKDISDPEIIHEFALRVGSTEYLSYLYLLTIADINATNPRLWNSWKDALLKELYVSTHKALRRGLNNPIAQQDKINETRAESRKELLKLGMSQACIDKAWRHVNDNYFLRYYSDEIVWNTMAFSSCNKTDLPLVLIRPQTQHGSAEIFIFMKNENFIFSLSTAILDQLGLTILDARIDTSSDQFILNSFQVLEQSGEPIKDLHREIHICNSLRRNLIKRNTNRQFNFHRQSRQAQHFPIAIRILFHNDPQQSYTELELITTDRAGLLSTVGQVFKQQKIIISSAKITTIGSRVEDIFHITDQHLNPITDPAKQQLIKDELMKVLS